MEFLEGEEAWARGMLERAGFPKRDREWQIAAYKTLGVYRPMIAMTVCDAWPKHVERDVTL